MTTEVHGPTRAAPAPERRVIGPRGRGHPPHRDGALPGPPNLRDPVLFLNRERSWLAFNCRVLHEALDARTPLLERVKFLAIVASNLDEFFQVRVAGLRHQIHTGRREFVADKRPPEEQLDAIRAAVRDMITAQSECLRAELLPALASHGIVLHDRVASLPMEEQERLERHFTEEVAPLLTQFQVDEAHPFPQVRSLALTVLVLLADPSGEEHLALVTLPSELPRLVPLAPRHHFLPLEHLVGAHLGDLFPDAEVLSWHMFRVTRGSTLSLETDGGSAGASDDLLQLMEEEVQERRFGEVVRVEVHVSMPRALRSRLLHELNAADDGEGLPLVEDDLLAVFGPLDLTALWAIAGLELPELQDAPLPASVPQALRREGGIFDRLRQGPILLHHPYHDFEQTVERFLAEAVDDPAVRRIRVTLYRTGRSLAALLLRAAERGKQVRAMIELQARFDEENNISWAKRFDDAGVITSYGVRALKTHAKLMLVDREEGGRVVRYAHVGTGNYNSRTARLYTDLGLLTADPAVVEDVSALFDMLTATVEEPEFHRLLVAPRDMKDALIAKIRREAGHARLGGAARIIAKMNSLVDPEVIEALYEASRSGVEVDLIVRGICCLRPGVPGASARIRVISIVGRFLEHSRVCYFHNGGDPECYIGSADWMPRNLLKRIEAAAPIDDPDQRARLLDWLEQMLADNRHAWDLGPDGRYTQRHPVPGEPLRSSQHLLATRID